MLTTGKSATIDPIATNVPIAAFFAACPPRWTPATRDSRTIARKEAAKKAPSLPARPVNSIKNHVPPITSRAATKLGIIAFGVARHGFVGVAVVTIVPDVQLY